MKSEQAVLPNPCLEEEEAEVKNEWIYTSTPQYAFMAWCLVVEAQGQLCLYLLPSIPGSSEWSLPLRFSDKNFVNISHLFHAPFIPRSPHSPHLDHANNA
jgi:hypothetical protein